MYTVSMCKAKSHCIMTRAALWLSHTNRASAKLFCALVKSWYFPTLLPKNPICDRQCNCSLNSSFCLPSHTTGEAVRGADRIRGLWCHLGALTFPAPLSDATRSRLHPKIAA